MVIFDHLRATVWEIMGGQYSPPSWVKNEGEKPQIYEIKKSPLNSC